MFLLSFLLRSYKKKIENNKNDLQWCRENFIGEEYIFSDNKSAMQDFSLIMFCDHNILSPASTFGWWAAYLNKHETKKEYMKFIGKTGTYEFDEKIKDESENIIYESGVVENTEDLNLLDSNLLLFVLSSSIFYPIKIIC